MPSDFGCHVAAAANLRFIRWPHGLADTPRSIKVAEHRTTVERQKSSGPFVTLLMNAVVLAVVVAAVAAAAARRRRRHRRRRRDPGAEEARCAASMK